MKNAQIESQENKEQSFYQIPNKALNDEEELLSLSEKDSSKNLHLINKDFILKIMIYFIDVINVKIIYVHYVKIIIIKNIK